MGLTESQIQLNSETRSDKNIQNKAGIKRWKVERW